MRDRPSGAELAALADALGARDAEAARCRAIEARERAAGDDAFGAIGTGLRAIYGEGDDRALLTRLVAAIRAGALDDGAAGRDALATLLRAITRQKLRESNPGYLGDPTPP